MGQYCLTGGIYRLWNDFEYMRVQKRNERQRERETDREWEREKETDKQTDRIWQRQRDRENKRCIYRQMDRWTDGWMDIYEAYQSTSYHHLPTPFIFSLLFLLFPLFFLLFLHFCSSFLSYVIHNFKKKSIMSVQICTSVRVSCCRSSLRGQVLSRYLK